MRAFLWLSVLGQFLETNAQTQKVIACPEQLGAALQACVSKECGKEDLTNKGHCAIKAADKSQCRCNPTLSAPAPLTTSLVTLPATTGVTGTYALATLTQYKDLRESITATITVPAERSDEPAATVAAVVFAGGVAWYLAGVVGGEAAAFTAPKSGGNGHQNDEKCAGDKPKCKDCGATSGFCVMVKPGCACEEEKSCPKTEPPCGDVSCKGNNGKCTGGDLKDCMCNSCPAGDKKPFCDDEKCKGEKDGKCTIENKDCECRKRDKCPDDIDAPFCSACGGEETDKSLCKSDQPCCKGDNTAKFKGCSCYEDDGLGILGYQNPVDRNAAAAWWKNVKNQEKSICQKRDPSLTEFTATQHAKDGEPSVEKAAKEWCASVNGKIVTTGSDVPYKFNKNGFSSFWLSASYRDSAPKELSCGKEAKVSGDDCFKSIMSAMERCEPQNKMTHGAAIGSGCIFYNVTLSGEMNADHPPWGGDKGKPKCDPKISNIERTFFRGLVPQFCSQAKDGKAIKKTLTNKDFKPASKSKRSPPPSKDQFEGYKFNFEFSGGENCKKSCNDAFEEVSSACVGQTTMRYKGSIDVGCGTYSYSIEDPPPAPPPKQWECKPLQVAPAFQCASDNCRKVAGGYPRSAFQAASHQFCYGGYNFIAKVGDIWSAQNYFWFDTTSIDPGTKLPAYCIGSAKGQYWQWSPDSQKYCKATKGLDKSDSKIELMVVPAKDQSGCKPLKDHKIPLDGACTKLFDQVAEGCITEQGKKDESGGYFLEQSDDGCWEWWIWGTVLT